MREELNRNLAVGGITVASAIDRVEGEVKRWNCAKYTHITRALTVNEHPAGGQVLCLETIFSKPTEDRPVPVAVVCVSFELRTATGELSYRFEQENVRHVVGGQSLATGKFEHWLDRIIRDKLQVRQIHDLATPFEETRLAPPPLPSEHPSEDEAEAEAEEAERKTDAAAVPSVEEMRAAQAEKQPLSTLLANIFDAADEEDEYELTHKEVADLLYATPLGLADWDIKLLLTTAIERDTGKIEYKPFVQAAPDIVEALLKRRAAFTERTRDAVQVNLEAIDLCFCEEIEEVARAAKEAFAAQDTAGKNSLSRHEFRSCLLSRGERFSPSEVQMLMQMAKEDEYGQVPYDDFNALLQQLRIDALHNALVETDVQSLRVHLILLMRREGLTEDAVLPIWALRNVLLNADQLCLSRMQIHVILSIVHPDETGAVDVEYFLRVVCTVIPYMFDTTVFMEKASTIAKDKADAQAKQELEELQGLSSSLAKRRNEDEDQEDVQANAPDRDFVEKALIHAGNQVDDKHRQQPTLDAPKFLEAMRHESVMQCQLSDAELRGFIAEGDIDERGEIAYVEHIKTWVPILFELRKSRIYDAIFAKDWAMEASHLTDLTKYEGQFSLLPGGKRRSTSSGDGSLVSSRRPSARMGSHGSQRRSLSRNSKSSAGLQEAVARLARTGSKRTMDRSNSRSRLPGRDSDSEGGSRAPSRSASRTQ
eukprot:TRINITY_DN91772_c0_g1_i1.p1 TRINITY_DN91772_c0_g1~~TRINITY_DN91772_c0_g1_i1.p1  ORF type:complete len:708 (-),score=221.30 TRINITY_DN91772_c0_g1_i1:92-2215(-)